jgi:hypothetical protein
MIYTGTAVEHARTLAKCAWGGQIILTEAAWEEMGDSLPSGTHVLSLGLHTVDGSSPMALMELVPNGLSARNFASLRSGANSDGHGRPHVERLAPGYRDSPDPDTEMAIVFVSTHVPAAEELTVRKAVELFGDRLRGLLNVHGGYECKEPEPGKFTLSFGTFQGAVRFSAELHLQLLDACWPAELLCFPGCGEQYDDGGGLIYRGLRARIGIAFSKPTSRKPLSSGRAGAWQLEGNVKLEMFTAPLGPPSCPFAVAFAGLDVNSFACALPPFLFYNQPCSSTLWYPFFGPVAFAC